MLIPAAGQGRRMGAAENKALLPINGVPLIEHTVRVFREHPLIDRIRVVARKSDFPLLKKILSPGGGRGKVGPLVLGGETRQESVWRGIAALDADPPDWVLVHDGARPLCSRALVDRVLAELPDHPSVAPVLPVSDTIRRIVDDHSEVVEREALFRSQTPQGFHWAILRQAHHQARGNGLEGTDDAQLVEMAGLPVHFVRGDAGNIKVTGPEDLLYAELALGMPAESNAGGC